jgi:hypothetical protein
MHNYLPGKGRDFAAKARIGMSDTPGFGPGIPDEFGFCSREIPCAAIYTKEIEHPGTQRAEASEKVFYE